MAGMKSTMRPASTSRSTRYCPTMRYSKRFGQGRQRGEERWRHRGHRCGHGEPQVNGWRNRRLEFIVDPSQDGAKVSISHHVDDALLQHWRDGAHEDIARRAFWRARWIAAASASLARVELLERLNWEPDR